MNLKSFRPMLAAKLEESDLANLKYPLILQPKLDGIRCCIVEGKAVSRKLKPIPNAYIRSCLEQVNKRFTLLDGELICPGKTFNEIQSEVMTELGKPNFTYVIFDCLINNISSWINRIGYINYMAPFINALNYKIVNNLEELLEWEQYVLRDGYEGIILRDPNTSYKFGRSTIREQALLKFKRFKDSEAEIISSNCFLSNCNELELDELGYAKRSSSKYNMVAEDKLGSWIVKDCNPESEFYNVTFNIGSGFTDKQRVEYWKDMYILVGKKITYKYQAFGSKNKPRGPIFKGFRNDI